MRSDLVLVFILPFHVLFNSTIRPFERERESLTRETRERERARMNKWMEASRLRNLEDLVT